MIKTLKNLREWAKANGHKIERWKYDDKSCYRLILWYGTEKEIISAQYFYWALCRIANAMEATK